MPKQPKLIPWHKRHEGTPKTEENILKLHSEGYSQRQIAKLTGYKSTRSIGIILRRNKDK